MGMKSGKMQVLIVGGGVAAIEAALALDHLARGLVKVTMLAPDEVFTYRPELVGEPFSRPLARHYPLSQITRDAGAQLLTGSLRWIDTRERVVHTVERAQIRYDVVLLALGARSTAVLRHAVTVTPIDLDEQLHGPIRDLETKRIHSVAFVIPDRSSWPLPMYELALMAARRGQEMDVDAEVTLVTPEDAPLAIFGERASDAVQAMLRSRNVRTIASAGVTMPRAGHLRIHPSDRELKADLIVTLPELSGPAVPGIPLSAEHGFVRIDREGRVAGAELVFAAGDLTDFPIKLGSIAAQQADSAATAMAIMAGADIPPEPLVPVLCGCLWNGGQPMYLRAQMTGTHGPTSAEVSSEPLWSPPDKIHARYLGPYLQSVYGAAKRTASLEIASAAS